MKFAGIALIASMIATTIGCQSAHPAPGMATVEAKVIARPKAGIKQPVEHVETYDAGPSHTPETSGTFEHVDYKNLTDIVVWLEPTARSSAAGTPAEAITVPVNPGAPPPHVQAASVGQRIVFLNSSSRPLTLYSVSDGNEFNLPPIAPGATSEFKPTAEGLIEILYDTAKPPVALVYAAPNAFVASAKSGATVTFHDVPPGMYRLIAWHPRLPGSEQSITLAADQVARPTVTIGVNSLPAVNSR